MPWLFLFIPLAIGLVAAVLAWNSGRFCMACNRALPPNHGSNLCNFCNALDIYEAMANFVSELEGHREAEKCTGR